LLQRLDLRHKVPSNIRTNQTADQERLKWQRQEGGQSIVAYSKGAWLFRILENISARSGETVRRDVAIFLPIRPSKSPPKRIARLRNADSLKSFTGLPHDLRVKTATELLPHHPQGGLLTKRGRVVTVAQVGGLHHRYERRAA